MRKRVSGDLGLRTGDERLEKNNLLITNGTVITMTADEPNRVIENGALLIEGDKIAAIGTANAVKRKSQVANPKLLDAGGKLILPANICAHTHFYGAFARGMAVPGKPAKNFVEVLKKLWWKLDRALDLDGVRYSALVCLVDAIKHGTTTLIDHHASPNAIAGSLNAIATAVQQTGLRAALCYEVTDRNGLDGAKRGIAENVAFAQSSVVGHPSSVVRAALGVHASFTISDKTLDASVAAAHDHNLPFHIHVAEDMADEIHAHTQYNTTVVQRLKDHGALDDMSMLAHCIHIDEAEMELIAAADAKVMHQPRSNMNNGVGAAPIEKMLGMGICVGLGNDGFSNDAFAEMKTCDMLHKLNAFDPRAMGADKITRMVYGNNAEIAKLFWPQHTIGTLRVGAQADVILMDYKPFTPLHAGNVPWHLLFGMGGGMVTHTICNGVVLMADRKLTMLDEAEICAKAKRAASRAWKRVQEL